MGTNGMNIEPDVGWSRGEILWFLYSVFMIGIGIIYLTLIIYLDIQILMLENWYLLSHLEILVIDMSFFEGITLELLRLHAETVTFFMLGYLGIEKVFKIKQEQKAEKEYRVD